MIINAANLATLFKVYSAAYQRAFSQATPMWNKVATLVPSSGAENLYGFLGQFPNLREWLGDRQIKNIKAHDYAIKNKDYEVTFGVRRPEIEDDQYGVYSTIMEEMGYSAKMHPDTLVFGLLALGASTLGYDGQFFFDTDHPVGATTGSNYDSAGGGSLWVLMDNSRPLKPLVYQKRKDYMFQQFNRPEDEHVFKTNEFLYGVDARCNVGFGLWQMAYGSLNTLDATNYETYLAAMLARKGDEGHPLNTRPTHVCIGPSRLAAARALFETQYLAGGATNPHYKEVEIIVSPYLT